MVSERAIAAVVGFTIVLGVLDGFGLVAPLIVSTDSFTARTYSRTVGSVTMTTRLAVVSLSAYPFRTCSRQAATTTCAPPTSGCGGYVVTESCSEGAPPCLEGGEYAMRAFGIVSILVAFLGCVPLGWLRSMGKTPLGGWTKFAMAACAGVLLLFEILFWVCFLIVWYKPCPELGDKSYSDFEPCVIGASPASSW